MLQPLQLVTLHKIFEEHLQSAGATGVQFPVLQGATDLIADTGPFMACTREFVILREGAGYRLHHFSAMAPSISQRPEERFGATMETFAPLVAL